MKLSVIVLAMIIVAGCDRKPQAPAAQPASDDKAGVELKLDTKDGAIEFKKDEGDGDDVNVEIKTE